MSLQCSLCEREIPSKGYLERHHLTPRSKGGKGTETAAVCTDCGKQIHLLLFTNKYNTIESLKADERVKKWIEWVKKRPLGVACHKIKKRK